MSFVFVSTNVLAASAAQLGGIGAAINQAQAAAAPATTALAAAAGDEVSASIAALFSDHAQQYQALSVQAASFHDRFVQALTAGAGSMRPPRPPTPIRCSPCSLRSTRHSRRRWDVR